MRRALSDDIGLLVDLMAEFYAEANYQLDRTHAADAFSQLLADERLGYAWIIEDDRQAVGHVVVTLRFAMEYGGIIACLDDLYVRPSSRNRGLATRALLDARHFCETRGVRAMTVEVSYSNAPAQKAYRRAGYAEAPDRQILALALAAPSHVLQG
jgi:GNAT superfamily N-acetyltransferase